MNRSAGRTACVGARLAVALAVFGLVGCGSLNLGSAQATNWYSLNDKRLPNAGRPMPVALDQVLVIGPVDANPFYDSTQLAFSRSEAARVTHQSAAWTERPTKRLATLVERRLAADGGFEAVASATAGIRADLVLNLTLDEIYHDTLQLPGTGRVVVVAELIDPRTRSLLGRQRFQAEAPVAEPAAASAVRALSEALTRLLDELGAWVRETASGAARS
ncbi:MAG: ABC-type transport auxiliary lipoprotein family protein [Burkholderiaceae bacterium]